MSTIKLTRCKDEHGSVYYTAADTEFLKDITIDKHYDYHITAFNTNLGRKVRGHVRLLKDVKEWIAAYDEGFQRQLDEEKAEREAQEKRFQERLAMQKQLHEEYTKGAVELDLKEGDFAKAKFASLNKNGTIGEYAYECSLPQLDLENKSWTHSTTKGWHWYTPKHWTVSKVQVEQVIELSAEDYDHFALNLMDDDACRKVGLDASCGGTRSTYKVDKEKYPEDSFFRCASEEERNAWIAESWSVVALIKAEGRRPFYVDTQGYGYARYVALVA